MSTTTEPVKEKDDTYYLYDLKVTVVNPSGGRIYCGSKVGDSFQLIGEKLFLPPGQGFSIYSLGCLLPLLAAKQRETAAADWMSTDSLIGNPDPNCAARFLVERTERRAYSHHESTAVPLTEK